jgi:putative phage-type endonuclease
LKPGIEMKVLKDRKEWLKNRKKIGGSDAAAIIGQNPYKSNVELWKEKTGQSIPEDISEKPYVKYGTAAEEHLRELFKLDFPEYRVEYIENNSFMNEAFPFAQASLDGWMYDEEGRLGILEIKTTNIMQSQQKEKWKDRIPDNYYCQVLHYMAVLEADFVILKAQLKYDFADTVYLQTRHYKIEREERRD